MSSTQYIKIGSSSNLDNKIINIGGLNDRITIRGNVSYLQNINTNIKNNIIQLNANINDNNSSHLSGFQIRENNDNDNGFIKLNNDSNGFIIKIPNSNNIFKINELISQPYDILNYLYLQLHSITLLSSLLDTVLDNVDFTSQLTNLNNELIKYIPFNKIDTFNSTNNKVILGNGLFSNFNINLLNPSSISFNRFNLTTDSTYIFHGDGIFRKYSSITSHLRLNNINSDNDINIQNKKILRLVIANDDKDLINVQQMNSFIPQLYYDPSTLRLNTITTNNNISLNNNKITDIINPLNSLDISNIYSFNNILSNIDTFINNNSININKLNFNYIIDSIPKFLSDDGTFKTYFDKDALYFFNNFTFNDCGCVGRYGPTINKMRSNYSFIEWTQNSNYLDIDSNNPGIQIWTVPKTGCYQFEVAGPSGGYSYSKSSGGKGRIVTGLVNLIQGQKLKILIGQRSKTSIFKTNDNQIYSISGGSGATFVSFNDNTPLFVAGAGSSAINDVKHNFYNNGLDAPVSYIGNGNIINNINNNNNLYNTLISSSGYNQNGCYGNYINRASFLGNSFINGGIGGKGIYCSATPNNLLTFDNTINLLSTNNIVWQVFYSNTDINFSSIQFTTINNYNPSNFKLYYSISDNKDNLNFSTITNINYTLDGFINNNYELYCHFNNILIPNSHYFLIGCSGGDNFKIFNNSNNNILISNNSNSLIFTMFNYCYFLNNDTNLDINNILLPSQINNNLTNNSFNLSSNTFYSITLGSYQSSNYNNIIAILNNNLITPDGCFGGGSGIILYDNMYPIIPSSAGYLSGFSGSIDNNNYINNYAGGGGSYWNNNYVIFGDYSSKNQDIFGFVKITFYSINSILSNSINNNYILSQQELDIIAFCLVHILYMITILYFYKINIYYLTFFNFII